MYIEKKLDLIIETLQEFRQILDLLTPAAKTEKSSDNADPWAGQYVVYDHYKDQTYNGVEVYKGNKDWFALAKEICAKEGYPELIEIQSMTIRYESGNPQHAYAHIVDNPVYDPCGTACVGRAKTSAGFGPWVFQYDFDSADNCSQDCALSCADNAQNLSVFRSALFSAGGAGKK